MNGERVNLPRQFFAERGIDHTMALNPALAFEGARYDMDTEMRLPAGAVSSMPDMILGFVLDLDAVGGERGTEFASHLVFDNFSHAMRISLSTHWRQQRRRGKGLVMRRDASMHQRPAAQVAGVRIKFVKS